VALGTMSGAVLIIDPATRQVLQTLTLHRKYCHRVYLRNEWLVSVSHDYSVCILRREEKKEYKLAKQLKFSSIPEGVGFVENDEEILVGVRDSNRLRRVRLDEQDDDQDPIGINLSAFKDDHVTFNVLDLAVCPTNSKLVALASDRDRIFVYWVQDERCRLMATLTGHTADGMSVARVQWSANGKYIYGSSAEGGICVFDVVKGRMLNRLKHHTSGVRDLVVHGGDEGCMVSCSFDKTCVLWKE
jgi:WD40 repeat protein